MAWAIFAGITAHLDHVASLGVDGIWLSAFLHLANGRFRL